MSQSPKTIRIDVYYDFSCPWCYLGLSYLHSAIEQYGKEIDVVGHSYLIDLETDTCGEEMKSYCRKRWGSENWVNDCREYEERTRKRLTNWKYWSNSVNAHRLIHYAHDCNFQNIAHLIQLIFEAIFEEGKNVSSVETLVQLAKEAGLEGAEDVLSSNQYIKEVLEDDDFAKNNLEIPGVPYFIINNQFFLEGANPPAAFINVFHIVEQMSSS